MVRCRKSELDRQKGEGKSQKAGAYANAQKKIGIADRLLLFFIFVFPISILLFGTLISLNEHLLKYIDFLHKRIFIGLIIVVLLFIIAIAVFKEYLKRFYIYKKHICKRIIYFIPLLCLLVLVNWVLLIKKFNYKVSLIPSSNDMGAVLFCVIFAFLYLVFLVPLEKICEKVPWFTGTITTCQAISNFRNTHKTLNNAINNNIECFKKDYEKVSSKDRRFVIEKLEECHQVLQEITGTEKSSILKSTYNQTKSDITMLLTIINDFETDLDYARFITEDEIYMILPNINESSRILKRFLSLNY